jgi:DNA-binding FrmR family transcriptional regulator
MEEYPVGVYKFEKERKAMASYDADKENILTRLRRIEGQTRGLQRMVEEDKYCVDIMTQVASVQAALEQVSLMLMENHMRHCVTEAIQEGKGEEKISEVMNVLKRYVKS